MRTPEDKKAYNKEYASRPEVKEKKRIRNAQPDRKEGRRVYKKTEAGKASNRRSRVKNWEMHKPNHREKHLKTRYGLSGEDFNVLCSKQKGCCAICGTVPEVLLHVDHCHKTNKVRGLLCGNCNRGLGVFKDDVELLKRAIKYLQCSL